MRPDLYLRNAQIVMETAAFRGGLTIASGKIAQWIDGNPDMDAVTVIDAAGKLVLPGLIDGHVHFSEPGRAHWEGFLTGTRAAAAGGVTTVVEMPLNASPPTINPAALQAKQQAAAASAVVDYALWGGLVDDNLDQLDTLYQGGVAGFKAFLCESATDFRRIDDDLLYAGLRTARRLGTFVGVHAENEWLTRRLTQELRAAGRCDRRAWGEPRPPAAELEAIRRAIFWSKTTGGRLHVVHVSLAEGVREATTAKLGGVPVTVETCPHYLSMTRTTLCASDHLPSARRRCGRVWRSRPCGGLCWPVRWMSSPRTIPLAHWPRRSAARTTSGKHGAASAACSRSCRFCSQKVSNAAACRSRLWCA